MPTWPAHSSRPTNLRAHEACARNMTTMPLSRSAWRQTALLAFLFSQPLLLLVVRGWSSGVLLIGSMLCMVELAARRTSAPVRAPERAGNAPLAKWFYASFCAWALVTLVAALLRGHVDWPLLDSPARFVVAIPVFLYVRRTGHLGVRAVGYCAAAGLVLTLAHQVLASHAHDWSAERMSNYFADPLAFGYICLSLAFMSLASALSDTTQPKWALVFKLLAAAAGLYMSVQTASRSGWLALPLVLLCMAFFKYRALNLKSAAIATGLTLGLLGLGFLVSPTVQQRAMLTVDEVRTYSFVGMAPETSVGLRITFARIAADLILERPLTGYGDTQKSPPPMPAVVQHYASRYAQDFALASGFHNEAITNGIQSGAAGALATLALFVLPWCIYIRAIRLGNGEQRAAGLLGMVFGITLFVSSLSTEVFGLKYTASYYTLTTALLCGLCLRFTNTDSN